MNRRDPLDLQTHRAHPSPSILLPTHRTAPDNRRDPILLKNLVTEATNRLEAEAGKRGAAPLLRTLEAQVAGVDLQHALDGGDGAAGSDGGGMADAVDEVIEPVLAKGGEAVFVDDGSLAQHQRVALPLRC
jgi:hypothetical protein